MLEIDYKSLSITELETLLEQNKQKMSLLQEKVDKTKKEKEENLKEMLSLMTDLSNSQKQYYDYRLILGSPFFELTETERSTIEEMMPIYKQKIDKLKEDLQSINLDKVF